MSSRAYLPRSRRHLIRTDIEQICDMAEYEVGTPCDKPRHGDTQTNGQQNSGDYAGLAGLHLVIHRIRGCGCTGSVELHDIANRSSVAIKGLLHLTSIKSGC